MLDAEAEKDAPEEWLLGPEPGPEELADTAENRALVWRALQQLTPTQRASIVMRFFLGMKDKEFAEELGRPLSTVKWSIHAAKHGLRSLLHREDLHEGPLAHDPRSDRSPGESL